MLPHSPRAPPPPRRRSRGIVDDSNRSALACALLVDLCVEYTGVRYCGEEASMDIARRDLLTLSGLAFAGAMLEPSAARAQAPKRGGTLTLRVWDPPHFDPYLVV